jgi:uncharacterized protein DUF6457
VSQRPSTRDVWVEAFAQRLDLDPPTPEEAEALLELAAIAAHASERTAAPIACWLGGRSGEALGRLKEIAEEVGER